MNSSFSFDFFSICIIPFINFSFGLGIIYPNKLVRRIVHKLTFFHSKVKFTNETQTTMKINITWAVKRITSGFLNEFDACDKLSIYIFNIFFRFPGVVRIRIPYPLYQVFNFTLIFPFFYNFLNSI